MADTVTITFSGICTHFWDYVPNSTGTLPMRTVVPNAQGVFFGPIQVPTGLGDPPPPPQNLNYLIWPHMPLAIYSPLNAPPNTPQLTVLAGATLTIKNALAATDSANRRPVQPIEGFRLTEFASFAPSQEVVLSNRAAAYFDIDLASSVTARRAEPLNTNSPFITVVEIETDGPPILLIDRFPNSQMPETQEITLQESSIDIGITRYVLSITNTDFDPTVASRNFDFLLNYIAGAAGIPVPLKKAVPGMFPLPLQVQSPTDIADDFSSFTAFLNAGIQANNNWISPDYLQQLWNTGQPSLQGGPMPDSPACSDSHYP